MISRKYLLYNYNQLLYQSYNFNCKAITSNDKTLSFKSLKQKNEKRQQKVVKVAPTKKKIMQKSSFFRVLRGRSSSTRFRERREANLYSELQPFSII